MFHESVSKGAPAPGESAAPSLSLTVFCRWLCGHGARVEGPCSSWQRRLAAEPGCVSRRLPGCRISTPPPWAARAGQFQPLSSSWFPALGPGGGPGPTAQVLGSWHRSLATGPVCPGRGCSQLPVGPRLCQSLHPFCPESLGLCEVRVMQPAPGVTSGQSGSIFGTAHSEGTEDIVAGFC